MEVDGRAAVEGKPGNLKTLSMLILGGRYTVIRGYRPLRII